MINDLDCTEIENKRKEQYKFKKKKHKKKELILHLL